MQIEILINRVLQAVILLALQVLLFNHVHLGLYAVPLVTVLFVVWCPLNTPSVRLMIVSFLLGLVQDIFSGTLGVSAAAMTAAAFVQHPLFSAQAPRECVETLTPSIESLGWIKYPIYQFVLFAVHHAVFYSLLIYRIENIKEAMLSCLASLAVSYILGLLTAYGRKAGA